MRLPGCASFWSSCDTKLTDDRALVDAIAVSNLARGENSERQACVLSPSYRDGHASSYRQRNSTQEPMRFANRCPMVRFLIYVLGFYVLSSGNENLDRIESSCVLQQRLIGTIG